MFQVINPPSGSQTANVSWKNSMNADIGVIAVIGADQTTPCTNGTFAGSNSAPTASTSVTIISNPGDLTASIGFTSDRWVTPFTMKHLNGESIQVRWVEISDLGPGRRRTRGQINTPIKVMRSLARTLRRASAIQPPAFTISVSPSSRTVTQGASTSYSVTIALTLGFTGQVALSVSGLPTGARGSFNPNPATSSSTLSVTTEHEQPNSHVPTYDYRPRRWLSIYFADHHCRASNDHERHYRQRVRRKRVFVSDRGHQCARQLRSDRSAGRPIGQQRDRADFRDPHLLSKLDGDAERYQQRWNRQCHTHTEYRCSASSDYERHYRQRNRRKRVFLSDHSHQCARQLRSDRSAGRPIG